MPITKEQAVALFESKFWESMTLKERALFQMFEPLVCMPFPVFHEAVEKTLGRPVFLHEFVYDEAGIKKELLGEKKALSPQEIINLIPADKRVIVVKG